MNSCKTFGKDYHYYQHQLHQVNSSDLLKCIHSVAVYISLASRSTDHEGMATESNLSINHRTQK